MRAVLIALLLSLAAKTDLSADTLIIAASAADLASTEYALSKPGLYEGNPIMRERGTRLAVKAASTAAVIAAHKHLQKRNKTAAKILKVTVVVLWGGAAAWNLNQSRRR